MKIISTTIIALSLVLFTTEIFAQQEITVTDITKAISRGKQNGLQVNIYQANKKDVEKNWTKAIRQDTKSKVENLNNEIFITATYIDDISKDSINIYSIINEYQGYVELNFFVEKQGEFLDKRKTETEYLGARKFLRNFAVEEFKEAVKAELEIEKKKLKNIEDEMEQVIKANEKLFKNINEEERSIENAKNEIKTNEMDQDRARGLVQQQKDEIVRLQGSSEEVRKEADKVLKGFEGDLEKLVKKNDNLHKDIDKSEAKIRDHERDIQNNKGDITRKNSEVEAQKTVVYGVEKKLENIK